MARIVHVLAVGWILVPAIVAKPSIHNLDYAIKETHNPPVHWRRIGNAPKDGLLNLRIGLKMDRWDELERRLYEVSDPSHPEYGNHLSAEEVNELSKPNPEVLRDVHDWLESHGHSEKKLEYNAAKDWIKLTISVGEAEKLLKTDYSVFKHDDGTELVRAQEWSLPGRLHRHIVAIQPTNSFLKETPRKLIHKRSGHLSRTKLDLGHAEFKAKVARGVQGFHEFPDYPVSEFCFPQNPKANFWAITPTCIRSLYNTFNYTPKAPGKQIVGFVNYHDDTVMHLDEAWFMDQFRPESRQDYDYMINVIKINSGADIQRFPKDPKKLVRADLNQKGNLAGQILASLTYPIRLYSWNTGGGSSLPVGNSTFTIIQEPYLEWLDYMLKQGTDLPTVVSSSYIDDEQTIPKEYAIKVCQEFGKLSARGVSLLFPSGDNGVAGQSGSCISNDGTQTERFVPAFPASCPYVTAVGATTLPVPKDGETPREVAAWHTSDGKKLNRTFVSGGGFSNYFEQPTYQKSVVESYIQKLNDTNKGWWNASGRAYPDIAAIGDGIYSRWNGKEDSRFTTSASTAIAASIIGLLNDVRISKGKKLLGFLNPWLYSEGFKGFTDIVDGSARGCNVAGFPAGPGWDAVTGFGTPDFTKLEALMDSYASESPPIM